jgi:hypothetical protein
LLQVEQEGRRPVELTYQLEVRGALPRGVREELRRRFGELVVQSQGDRTVLSGLTVDQAALRALLGLLWDVGGELQLVRATATPSQAGKGAEQSC